MNLDLEPEMKQAIWPWDDDLISKSSDVQHHNQLIRTLKSKCKTKCNFLWETNLGDWLRENRYEGDVVYSVGPGVMRHERVERMYYQAITAVRSYILKNLKRRNHTPPQLSTKLNQLDAYGIPLLHSAIEESLVEVVAQLLANGADPSIETLPSTKRRHNKRKLKARDISPHPEFETSLHIKQIQDLLDLHMFAGQSPQSTDYFTVVDRAPHVQGPPLLGKTDLQNLGTKWVDSATWIHVRSTNGLMLLPIFRAVQSDGEKKRIFPPDFDLVKSFYESFEHPSIDPGDPLLGYREKLYEPKTYGDFKYTAIVFPCLVISTISQRGIRRNQYKALRDAMFEKVPNDYTVQLERTLDEAYYPGLKAEALEVRNQDQVVSKFWKNTTLDKHILMVPQIWLWRVGEIIVSAYSMAEPWDFDYVKKHEGEYGSSDEQLGFIIADLIEGFGKGSKVDGAKFSALDIFETSVTSLLSEVIDYVTTSKLIQVNYPKEQKWLIDLSDIRSELAMIQDVLEQQQEVLYDLVNDCFKSKAAVKDDGVKRAQIILAQYQKRINKIGGDAERIEKTIQDQLDLRRTYASIKDAHSSLLLGTAVIGFTVITIIFAPLSFLTALFALNIDGFDKLRIPSGNQSDVYNSGKMGAIFVSSEVLTILLTAGLVAASLWYITRQDEIKTGFRPQKPSSKNEERVKSKEKVSKRRNGRADLESQRES